MPLRKLPARRLETRKSAFENRKSKLGLGSLRKWHNENEPGMFFVLCKIRVAVMLLIPNCSKIQIGNPKIEIRKSAIENRKAQGWHDQECCAADRIFPKITDNLIEVVP